MVNNVISFKDVSKRFKRGRKLLLKEALIDIFKPSSTEWFWALNDIDFTAARGETIGIIGVNGSGKSTILKLVAGVMVPDKGSVRTKGRVAPLIELGAGFHPELSGRENIYLNGAILGLSREDVESKYKNIVKFAELAEFIDTPIKHYSSGMHMRLGFAIAVNTDPEILLVDEILAVGDEAFRKKCMRKMQSFKKDGTTILFVSHNMEAVESFCDRVVYIRNAKVEDIGQASSMVKMYRRDLGK